LSGLSGLRYVHKWGGSLLVYCSYILLCACCVFITADLFLIRGKKVGQDIQDVFPNQSFWFHFPYYCIVKTIDNVRQHGRENETKTWFVKTCGNLECDLWGPSKT
jgi:hypothetical protein